MKYLSATDKEALDGVPALLAGSKASSRRSSPRMRSPRVVDIAPQKPQDHLMVVNLSGRGDKDLDSVAEHLGEQAVMRLDRQSR